MSETNSPSALEIEALGRFARQHGEMAFSKLCVEALEGHYWAQLRIGYALHAKTDADRLTAIRNTDTVRMRVGQRIGLWRIAAIGPCTFLGTPLFDGEVLLINPSDDEDGCIKQIADLSDSDAF